MINTTEEKVRDLIAGIVDEAMATDYIDATDSFKDQLTPEMANLIETVFESGLRIGASKMALALLGASIAARKAAQ